MVYPIGKHFFKFITRPITGRITGTEHIPKKGAFIIAANHDSYMDHVLIATFFVNHLDRRIHFIAKKELFDGWFKKRFHNWVGAIPIDREAGGKDALRWAIKALKEGKIMVIHPEGTRSPNGALQRGKTGVARLALKAEVPVLPIGLRGTFEILPKSKKIPRLKKARMHIGKPLTFEAYYQKRNDKKTARLVTTRIMEAIGKLACEPYTFDQVQEK